ncbi:cell division protein SepF [Actinomadura xylanilytica]|uniref:cell division protein SepF n=1 Tax=Actinomadura xylanilytica TaxID=887459 RepID=UPI00255AC81C|nr:cell division protein SepF [Actinomadura xylanilytica]MDL4774198.1 cell division protein SepF [Actinomadura xylanilytica]
MAIRKAATWLGLVEHEDETPISEQHIPDDVDVGPDDVDNPNGQVAMGEGFQIAMVRPRNFRDAATIGKYYRQNIPVIFNLDDMDDAAARRIVDFASGLILGRRGDIERLSRRVFLILPDDTTILTAQSSISDEGFFNQE